jgi:hypothetical protein
MDFGDSGQSSIMNLRSGISAFGKKILLRSQHQGVQGRNALAQLKRQRRFADTAHGGADHLFRRRRLVLFLLSENTHDLVYGILLLLLLLLLLSLLPLWCIFLSQRVS